MKSVAFFTRAALVSAVFLGLSPAAFADSAPVSKTAQIRALLSDKKPKNVILFIGDGMGDSEITSARNYIKGAGGRFEGIDTLPFTGSMSTYSLLKKNGKPEYVTDSAASASAWSTGVKTYNYAVGVDISDTARPNLLELAKKAGKGTGNITTAGIADATPAGAAAHITDRKCAGPQETAKYCPKETIEAGGRGSIVEQELALRADITMGGGLDLFKQTVKSGGKDGAPITLLEKARAAGYQIVFDRQGMEALKTANSAQPVLGLFSDGDMPFLYTGANAVYHGWRARNIICAAISPKRAFAAGLTPFTAKKSQVWRR